MFWLYFVLNLSLSKILAISAFVFDFVQEVNWNAFAAFMIFGIYFMYIVSYKEWD